MGTSSSLMSNRYIRYGIIWNKFLIYNGRESPTFLYFTKKTSNNSSVLLNSTTCHRGESPGRSIVYDFKYMQ